MSYQLGRRRGLGWGFWRGLGYISPVGFADFGSFQTAAIASYPSCPPPFDPTCESPRDAAIAANLEEWHTNPRSCGVIVCDSSGQPAAALPPLTSSSAGSLQSPVFHPTKPLPAVPRFPGRPVPIQSSSPAAAPGGPAAPSSSPTPVQTQTPPVDTSTTPIVLPSDCGVGQSYVYPGQLYQYPPNVGQVAYQGACETIPAGTAPAASDFGSFLSSIPVWGWGVAVLGVVLLTRGGKR